MIQNDINKIINYCTLAKNETIKSEILKLIDGYKLYDMKSLEGIITCFFKDNNNNKMELTIKEDSFEIFKNSQVKQELITIDSNLDMIEKTLERRPKGVKFSVVSKSFRESSIYKNRTTLSHLIEQRYTFTDDTLNSNFINQSLSSLFKEMIECYEKKTLDTIMDYNSIFEIHSYLSRKPDSNLLYEDFHTFLNGQDLGNIYNIFNSPTKVYRIYDLYRGLITPRNELDINLIHEESLSDRGFNLRELKNLTFEENNLVGPTTLPIREEYYEYVKNFLKDNYGYFGEIAFDRDTLLSAITYKMTASELVKRDIARTLGISYEDFIKLDTNKQQKLAEQFTHKKVKPGVLEIEEKETRKKNSNVSLGLNNEQKDNPLKKVLKIFKKQ